MSIKYKIDDAKKNKNLINDEIKLSRIKSKVGPSGEKNLQNKGKHLLDLLSLEMNKENLINLLCKDLMNKLNLINNS